MRKHNTAEDIARKVSTSEIQVVLGNRLIDNPSYIYTTIARVRINTRRVMNRKKIRVEGT